MDNTQALRRQERIVRLLASREQVTVKELAGELRVSGWTVRRDLDQLEQRRIVRRHHGRVELNTNVGYEGILAPSVSITGEIAQLAAKRRIGQAAASLIAPDQHVAIGAGTTTIQVAQSLRGRTQMRVVTNGMNIAMVLGSEPGIRVTCTGGDVDVDYLTLTGPVAERTLRGHFFDVAVIGVSGISAREGLTVTSPLNAVYLGLMIEHSARVIVVADQTKLGRVCFASLCQLDAVDALVIDAEPPLNLLQALRQADVRIIVA